MLEIETEKEIWKDVVGYEGLYQVSNLGRVKSLARSVISHYTDRKPIVTTNRKERIMKQFLYKTGYLYTGLAKNRVKKKYKIHRLVAMAFIPNPENKPMVNHIDGNPLNNRVENLEWCTNQENQIHAIKTGLNKSIGVNSHWSKFTEEQIRYIRANFKLRDKDFSCVALAKKFNVTPTVISFIMKGKTYQSVK